MIRRLFLALPLLALLGVMAVPATRWHMPQAHPALGAGPMAFDPTMLPGLDAEAYRIMLCPPADYVCAYGYWGIR